MKMRMNMKMMDYHLYQKIYKTNYLQDVNCNRKFYLTIRSICKYKIRRIYKYN